MSRSFSYIDYHLVPSGDRFIDLLSLVMTLGPSRKMTLPPRLGRAARAIFLERISSTDPELAETLHGRHGPKPYSCSNLMGPREGSGFVFPGASYTLRYTALSAPVAVALDEAFEAQAEVGFEGVPFTVEARTAEQEASPWAGHDTYQEMAAPHLRPSRPAPEPSFRFLLASPTAFQSQGRTTPLPLPGPFFGSLVKRWNALAPLALPEEDVRRYANEMVVVSRFALRSAPGWTRGKALRIGAVGEITRRALSRDRYGLSVLHLLADYARFADVGAMTTMGMGQVRHVGLQGKR